MSKVGEKLEHVDDSQGRLYFESYCNLKDVLSQEAFMKSFGDGTFEDFCIKIDEMNRDE
mgnify:FL=1